MKPKGEEENLTTSSFIGARTNSYWTEDEATWAIQDFNFLFTNVFPLDDETTLPSGAMETMSSLPCCCALRLFDLAPTQHTWGTMYHCIRTTKRLPRICLLELCSSEKQMTADSTAFFS